MMCLDQSPKALDPSAGPKISATDLIALGICAGVMWVLLMFAPRRMFYQSVAIMTPFESWIYVLLLSGGRSRKNRLLVSGLCSSAPA